MVQQKQNSALEGLRLIVFLLLISLGWGMPQVSAPYQNISIKATTPTSSYWIANIQRQGTVAFGNDASYKVFRNVMDYGAKGDGVTDDTNAINAAITDNNRCGQGCDSSTTTPAIVYFPPGTYAVSSPLIQFYYTQFIGDAITLPTIKALPNFQGLAVIDSDPYIPGGNGAQWYTNQNNFYRQVRNFYIDITSSVSIGACIHWQVAQATSLQNVVFNMVEGGGPENKQQGIFMDNGSGGFMVDLVFNGGYYGAFLGNQQFTTRNWTFNNCETAIYMNWNWLWTMKSVSINNCGIGLDMSGLDNNVNQTVGSVLLIDSSISNTPVGVKTSYNMSSVPTTGGTLIMQNVDFSQNVPIAVAAGDGSQILAGNAIVAEWAQGNAYRPSAGLKRVKRAPQLATASVAATTSCNCETTTTVTVSPVPITITTSPANTTTSSTTLPSNSSATSVSLGTCSTTMTPVSSTRIQQQLNAPTLPAALMAGGKIFERSKPQYETIPASSFISVKSRGAKGDCVNDDTAAIQAIFNSTQPDQIVYFDHGCYLITDTVYVPANIKITGEIWPLIMADGSSFNDQNNPRPVFQVGVPGESGAVEMSDLIFETLGPAPGAIMMEWNLQSTPGIQGGCGLWDVHFRIGATAGTKLQQDTCQANVTGSFEFKPECAGAFVLFHATQQSNAYLENVWLWVGDHELDLPQHNQTNIYNGRGMLIESQGATWLYGTSVEHSQLYNYQLVNAQNVFMGAIQSETAYMQSAPNALNGGFTPNLGYNDPDFADCTDDFCRKTWGLRVVDSQDIYVYGAGLYSFFDNYKQDCLDTESCQTNMVDIECSSGVYLYGLSTKAATNMVTVNGESVALQKDNTNGFCQTIALFDQQGSNMVSPARRDDLFGHRYDERRY